MRHIALAIALATVASASQAQAPGWNMYEAEGQTAQAFVAGTNGAQLIIKCDRTGQFSTYAVIATGTKLAMASQGRYETRPVKLRYDDGTAIEDTWRFNDEFATAFDDRSQRTMTRFIQKLLTASKLDVQLEPFRQAAFMASFQVANSKEAISKVYASCKDKMPAS